MNSTPVGIDASMKAPPKRKGNLMAFLMPLSAQSRLNESPSEKEGKSLAMSIAPAGYSCLNESPSEKEGKYQREFEQIIRGEASMKAPPKRKGNTIHATTTEAGAWPQ